MKHIANSNKSTYQYFYLVRISLTWIMLGVQYDRTVHTESMIKLKLQCDLRES